MPAVPLVVQPESALPASFRTEEHTNTYTCKIVYEKPHSNKPKQVPDKCIAHTHQTNPPTVSSIAAEKGVAFHDSPLGSKSLQYFIQLQIEDFAQHIQPVLRHINVLRFLESKACHVL